MTNLNLNVGLLEVFHKSPIARAAPTIGWPNSSPKIHGCGGWLTDLLLLKFTLSYLPDGS
jgi:hypothetical protein